MFAALLRNEEHFDPYQILGLESTQFTVKQLQRKWRQAAKRYHPDLKRRGGSKEAMQNALLAYEILSSPEKKKIYDTFGTRALNHLKRKAPPPEYDRIPPPRPPTQKDRPKFHTCLPVTFKDLYMGCYKNVRVKFEDECHACYSRPQQCPFCYGRGEDIQISQSNPRSMMQTWKKCEHCKGTGLKPLEPSKCLICRGTRKIRKKQKIRVEIEPGMKHGQTIIKQLSKIAAALTLKVKRHPIFKCVGNDLYIFKRIPLKQALTGTQFTITTLDGRTLEVQTPQSMVVKPEFSYRIENEGMPIFRSEDPNKRGDLYIKFAVDFPKQPSADEIKFFKSLTRRFDVQDDTPMKEEAVLPGDRKMQPSKSPFQPRKKQFSKLAPLSSDQRIALFERKANVVPPPCYIHNSQPC